MEFTFKSSSFYNRGEEGNCYLAAFLVYLDMIAGTQGSGIAEDLCIAHGAVLMRNPGEEYHQKHCCHAWVEYAGAIAIDASRVDREVAVIQLHEYLYAGRCKSVKRYNAAEILEICKHSAHTGPWEQIDEKIFDNPEPELLLSRANLSKVRRAGKRSISDKKFMSKIVSWFEEKVSNGTVQ